MPLYLQPATLLGLVDHLPRTLAGLCLVAAASMLVFGLRGFRLYATLALAAAAYPAGLLLAAMMHVPGLYVAAPLAAAGALVGYFMTVRVLVVCLSGLLAVAAGFVTASWLDLPGYAWWGFGGGAALGLVLSLAARRAASAILCAMLSSALIVTNLGAVLRAADGPFSIGGYAHHPLAFLVAGGVLFAVSLLLQGAVRAESSSRLSVDGVRS
jgi:hypothetical protein